MKIYLFFILLFLWPLAGQAFPWPKNISEKSTKEEGLDTRVEIRSHAIRFFSEKDLRYFVGGQLKASHSFFGINADYDYSISENEHYFRPYEAYMKVKRPDGLWVLGRKSMEWDWADKFWNRYLWEPAYFDDSLRPQSGGLTGIFRNFNYTGGQVRLFGSFIFMPSVSPPVESKEGKVTSKNPWFFPPPSGKFGATNIVPHYKITDLDWKKFLQLSLGGRVSYNNFYIAYMYKPLNQIKLSAPISLQLDKELKGSHQEGFQVETPVQPVILKHHLVSGGFALEASEQQQGWKTSYRLKTSFTYNHPEEHTVKSDIVWFQPRQEGHISAVGEIHVKDFAEETLLHLGYTHLFYFEDKKENQISKAVPSAEKLFFSKDPFLFSKSFSAGLTHNIKFEKNNSADLKARLIYDLPKDYFLLSLHCGLTLKKAFSIFASADFLFSEFPFSLGQTQENIGIYENKSRIFGGIKYAF